MPVEKKNTTTIVHITPGCFVQENLILRMGNGLGAHSVYNVYIVRLECEFPLAVHRQALARIGPNEPGQLVRIFVEMFSPYGLKTRGQPPVVSGSVFPGDHVQGLEVSLRDLPTLRVAA